MDSPVRSGRPGNCPSFRRRFRLASGAEIERDCAQATISVDGSRSIITICVFGDEGSEPLLGAITLEEMGLGVDPLDQRLIPVTLLLAPFQYTVSRYRKQTRMTEKDVIKETKPRMEAAIEDVRRKLATVRTGRASVSLLDTVMVDYYGTATPLNQMASVHAPEPQMLTVQPWDPTQLGNVEKAIRAADLGLNPSNDGKLVRIPIPPLTEERRKQLARQVHDIAEEHRTAIRNIRRDENDKLKKMLKDKAISEDAERAGLEDIQKLTDIYISKIDELSKSKEHELMSV